jgi:hypothetical protein
MSDPRYLQNELEKCFDHLAEECGEFISAYGKMRRWGAFSYNPELPKSERESNIHWVEREITDVIETATRLKNRLNDLSSSQYDDNLEKAFPLYND